MSEENMELARGWFERWNSGDRAFLDEIHPEVEFFTQLQPTPFRGRDGFEKWIAEIDEQFQKWRLVPEEWHQAGDDCVVALGHIHLQGHGGGVEFDQPAAWILEIEGDRLRRMRSFLDPAAALEAAGLGG